MFPLRLKRTEKIEKTGASERAAKTHKTDLMGRKYPVPRNPHPSRMTEEYSQDAADDKAMKVPRSGSITNPYLPDNTTTYACRNLYFVNTP